MRRREAGCEAGWIDWPVRALFDKVARSDVLWHAWLDVRAKRSGRRWATEYNLAWFRRLGVHTLSGSVRYGSAHASR